VIDGKVYDMSEFYTTHPGGPDVIFENRAKDASQVFTDAEHPQSAIRDLEKHLIGEYMQPKKFMKLEEIADHNQAGDLWLLINNKVFDVSKFKHPGKHALYSCNSFI
jgi:cytochrome b involved in lipid metabolism